MVIESTDISCHTPEKHYKYPHPFLNVTSFLSHTSCAKALKGDRRIWDLSTQLLTTSNHHTSSIDIVPFDLWLLGIRITFHYTTYSAHWCPTTAMVLVTLGIDCCYTLPTTAQQRDDQSLKGKASLAIVWVETKLGYTILATYSMRMSWQVMQLGSKKHKSMLRH